MRIKLEDYKWLMDNIKFLEKRLESAEKNIEVYKKLKDFKIYKKIIKPAEEHRELMIDKLLKAYSKAEEIESFIETLESKEKQLIRLRYQQKLSWSEVASVIDYSESHVKKLHKKIFERAKSNE